jgi:hypothetical protein
MFNVFKWGYSDVDMSIYGRKFDILRLFKGVT